MSLWFGVAAVAVPVMLFGYAYVAYPIALAVVARRRTPRVVPEVPATWPTISITVPCYNEAARLGAALDALLAAAYPADRREILVISDASTDETDAIAEAYRDRGVRLIRLPDRRGKTAAEHAGVDASRGEIVVNVDASVLIDAQSLTHLVRALGDPTVGVASSRDVSVGEESIDGNSGESGYVGYEMWVRALETRVYSIVGASGSFFAMRRSVHQPDFPEGLSRDFAAALLAVEKGYRAVSVEEAICFVPRTHSLSREYHRKARTMARGLQTLWYKRHLMNPVRYGLFAWMLISHKLCRWLASLLLPLGMIGLLLIAWEWPPAQWLVLVAVLAILLGAAGTQWPSTRRPPTVLALPGYALVSSLAGLVAWTHALGGRQRSTWEPTRRGGIRPA
jgi:cellulose synthase/poly-beta-1,6-N-acetylglucosamine synthase-like glycosyltransferase